MNTAGALQSIASSFFEIVNAHWAGCSLPACVLSQQSLCQVAIQVILLIQAAVNFDVLNSLHRNLSLCGIKHSCCVL